MGPTRISEGRGPMGPFMAQLRLPRFSGRLVGLRSYVLVMAACMSVSKDIGERYPKPECSRTGLYQPSI
jgi:hypothetical protein